MEVTINDIKHEVLFDLNLISLGAFVDYHDTYGRDLDKALKALQEKIYEGDADEIELNRSIDFDNHLDNEALSWYSFWTKHDLFEVKDQPFIAPVLSQYRAFRFMLNAEMERAYDIPATIEFNEEEWEIKNYVVNPASGMSFNEIVTSKEVTRQIHRLGKGNWDALPYLCAIFLRKKNEDFADHLILEGGDRMELQKTLPLTHAIQVAFFLSICVNIWSRTSQSLIEKEPETASLS